MQKIKASLVLLFSVTFSFAVMANVNVWQNVTPTVTATTVQTIKDKGNGTEYVPGTIFNFASRKKMVLAGEYGSSIDAATQSIGTPIYSGYTVVQNNGQLQQLQQTGANGIINEMTLLTNSSGQYYLGYAYYGNNKWIEQNLLTVPQNIFSGTVYLMSAAFYNTNSPSQYGFAVLTDAQGDQYGFMCINGAWTSPLGNMPNLNDQAANIYVNGSGNNAALVIAGSTSFSVISYANNNWNLTTLPNSITNISQIAFDWDPTGSGEYLSAAVLAQNGIYQIVSGQTSLFESQDTLDSGSFTNMTLPTFNAYTGGLSSVIVQTTTSQGNPNNFLLKSTGVSSSSSGSNVNVLNLGTWTLPWVGLTPNSPVVQNALVPIMLGTYSSVYQNSNLSNYFTPSQTIAAVSTLNSSNTYNTWLWTQNDGWISLPIGINTASSIKSASLRYSSPDSFSGSTLTFNNTNVFLQGPNNNVLTTTTPYSTAKWTSQGPKSGYAAVVGPPSSATVTSYPSLQANRLYLWVEANNAWQATPYGYSTSGAEPNLGSYLSNFAYSICGDINWTNGTASSDMGLSSAVIAITESLNNSEVNCKLYDLMEPTSSTYVQMTPTNITLKSSSDEISQIQSNFNNDDVAFTAIETTVSSNSFEYAFLGNIAYNSSESQLTPYISKPITLSSSLSGRYTLRSSNIFQGSTVPTTAPACAVIELRTGSTPTYSFYYLTASGSAGTIAELGANSSNAWSTYSPTSYFVDWGEKGDFVGIAILVNNGTDYNIYSYGSDITGSGNWAQFKAPSVDPLNLISSDAYILSSVHISSSGGINYININDQSGINAYTYNYDNSYITIPQGTNLLDENGKSTIYTITAVGPYASDTKGQKDSGTWPSLTSLTSTNSSYELYQVTVNTPSPISLANMLAGENGYYCYADISGPGWSSNINQYGFPINGFTINSNGITPNKYVFYIVAPTQVTTAEGYSDAYTVTFSEADMSPTNENWGYKSTLGTSITMLLPADVQPPTSVTSPAVIKFNYQMDSSVANAPQNLLVLDPNGVCAVPVQIELQDANTPANPIPNTNQYYDKITFEVQVVTLDSSGNPSSYNYYPITESPSSNPEGIYMQPASSDVSPQYGYTSIQDGQDSFPEGDYKTFYFYSSKVIDNTRSKTSCFNIIPTIYEGNVSVVSYSFPFTSDVATTSPNIGLTASQACMIAATNQTTSTWEGAEFNLKNPSSATLSSGNCLWNPYYDNGSIIPNYLFSNTISNNGVFSANSIDASTGASGITQISMENLKFTPSPASATIPTPTNPLFFVFPEGVNEQTLSQRIDTASMPISVWPDKYADNANLTSFSNMDSYPLTEMYPDTGDTTKPTWQIKAGTISPLSFISFDDTCTNNSITSHPNAGTSYMFAFTQYGDPVGKEFTDSIKNNLFNENYLTTIDFTGKNIYSMHLLLSNNYSSTTSLPLLFTGSTLSNSENAEGINAANLLNNSMSQVLIPYGKATDIVTMNNATPQDTANQYQINIASPLNPQTTVASSTLTDAAMLRGKSYFKISSNLMPTIYSCTFTCGSTTDPTQIYVNGSLTDTLASEAVNNDIPASLTNNTAYTFLVKEDIDSLTNTTDVNSVATNVNPLNTIWTYYTQDSNSTVGKNIPPCLEWAVEADNQTDADAQTKYYDLDLQIAPFAGQSNQHFSIGYDFAQEEDYNKSTPVPQQSPYSSGSYYALVGTNISAVATGVQDTISDTIGVPFIGVMVNNKPLNGINDLGYNWFEDGASLPAPFAHFNGFYNSVTNSILYGDDITALDMQKQTESITIPSTCPTIAYTPLSSTSLVTISGPSVSFYGEAPYTGFAGQQMVYPISYTPWAFAFGSYGYDTTYLPSPTIKYYSYEPLTAYISNITT